MARAFASVLIDTYNHERFIEKAIVSVLEQDFGASDREIIVVDDGSTDRTAEIVRLFEPRVRLVNKKNGGQASAFNAGIPECKGEIVAFLDGDDWWASKKLSNVEQAMSEDASVGIVGHGIVIVGRDGSEESVILGEGFRFQTNTTEGGKLFRRRGAFLGTSRMTIRAGLLKRIGAVPEAIEIQADEYLFTLATSLAEARILPEALTYYRMHEANNFQMTGRPEFDKLRRKFKSLDTIAKSLSQKLREFGIDEEVIRTVLAYTRLSAQQLRLLLDGGWPWETFRTEWALYRILHPDASFSRQSLKLAVLLAALVMTPKGFYRFQTSLTQNSVYRRARERWLPFVEMQHVQKGGRTGA